MSGPDKRAREEEKADMGVGAVAGGGARPAAPTLTDVAWIVAKNGYAADIWRVCGVNREMWRWIDPRWTAEQAACVRRDHPFWQAIINLRHGRFGETRLMWAIICSALEDVKELIAWHADVNATSYDGKTALILASRWCDVTKVRALLAAGAGVNAADHDGDTALISAIHNTHVFEVVHALLAAGADINATNNDGNTVLMLASHGGYVKIVRALLAAGANKHLISNSGETAHRAYISTPP